MLAALRPFLTMLWGALASYGRLPQSLVHARQCQVPLDWLWSLFKEVHGPLERVCATQPQAIEEGSYYATDASPWGFAGVRFVQFRPVEWFASPLSVEDLRRFRARVGESAHNTVWEALAILVALRLWAPGVNAVICVRSDSLSALRSMVKLSSSSASLNLIARELALDSILGLYSLGLATHNPGVANVLPDDLSRLWAPDKHSFPKALQGVPEVPTPTRGIDFWKSVGPSQRGGKRRTSRRRLLQQTPLQKS